MYVCYLKHCELFAFDLSRKIRAKAKVKGAIKVYRMLSTVDTENIWTNIFFTNNKRRAPIHNGRGGEKKRKVLT